MEYVNNIQEVDTLKFILWIAGFGLALLTTALSFFLARVVKDIKFNGKQGASQQAELNVLNERQMQDTKRISETTQLEISKLTAAMTSTNKNVDRMANSVEALVQKLIK